MKFKSFSRLLLAASLSFGMKGMEITKPINAPFNGIENEAGPSNPEGRDENDLGKAKVKGKKKEKKPKNNLRRTQSLGDLSGFAQEKVEEAKPTSSTNYVPNISSALTKTQIYDYLKEHLGAERANKISRKLTGKDKDLSLNDPAFEQIDAEEKEKDARRTTPIKDIYTTAETFGSAKKWYFKIVGNNSAASQKRETMILKSRLKVAEREKFKEIELEKARTDSEKKWQNEPEARRKEAREAARGTIKINRARMNLIKKHPYLLVGIAAGITGSYFAAKHGMKVLFNEVQRIIGLPTLAQDTSLLTFREKIAKGFGFFKEEILKSEEVIFNKEFKERIDALTISIKNTAENNGYFRNLLFYGVPGTGKTLTAKTIAKNSGLHYVYFAASGLSKFSDKEALNQVAELFEFAKRSPKKLMIIIDEAELLFIDRNNPGIDSLMKKVLNLILTYTGTESQDYFVVALTNRPQDLDDASISRADERLKFPEPDHEEIKAMLSLYIKKYLFTYPVVKPTLYQKWFGKKTQLKRIAIEPKALNNQAISAIAQKIAGFAGRDISKLVIAIKAEAYATKGLRITEGLVNKIVDRKIAENNAAHQKFKTIAL